MSERLLVIGAGLFQSELLRKAHDLGWETIAVDGNPNAMGCAEADMFIEASTMDTERVLQEVRALHAKCPISGVTTVGTDASYTVAVCAEALGLAGHTVDAAQRASNKLLMGQTLREAQVSMPAFAEARALSEVLDFLHVVPGPIVLKPIQNMGARGVSCVSTDEEVESAWEYAQQHNTLADALLVEEYIDAPELSMDALVFDGEIHVVGIADRIIEYPPYFVETGHILPSCLPQAWIDRALSVFRAGVKALGLSHGAAKGDIKVSAQGAWVIEIAARASGGFMSTHTVPAATGIDLLEALCLLAVNRRPASLQPTQCKSAVERSLVAPPGTIQAISEWKQHTQDPRVLGMWMDAYIGQEVEEPKSNVDKAGHVVVIADTRAEAIRVSNQVVQDTRIWSTLPDLDMPAVKREAQQRFDKACILCAQCDGKYCKGQVPGVGGIGTGAGFTDAYQAFRRYKLIPRYIHTARSAQTSCTFLGRVWDLPVFGAPITGVQTNMRGACTEIAYARAVVKGTMQAGTFTFVGDGADPRRYLIQVQSLLENYGVGGTIFKPREDQAAIIDRLHAAEAAGVLAVGIDVDGAYFPTMRRKNQPTASKSIEEIKELIQASALPFFVKGVLHVEDALSAMEAGVYGVIVSNHGGRVNDAFVSPIEVLPAIRRALGDDACIVVDGGIRTAADVAKALILGADAVLIGRPVMQAAVGAGALGVRTYFEQIHADLERVMLHCGITRVEEWRDRYDLLHLSP